MLGEWPPAVMVHGLAQARRAAAVGCPVTLLSGPGAAVYAGCGWWRTVVEQARAEHPTVAIADLLDCGESSAQALAALRLGLHNLVLWPSAPGWDAVAASAAARGGVVLRAAPVALDLARRGAERRLHEWLMLRRTTDDSRPTLR